MYGFLLYVGYALLLWNYHHLFISLIHWLQLTHTDNLSASQQKIAKDYAGDDESFVAQFLVYATRGKCLRDCKARTLPAHLRYIEPSVVQQFRQRKPFSYLHFAYYQVCLSELIVN